MTKARRREPRFPRVPVHPDVSGPVRTCVGCRRATSATDLLRVVADRGQLVLDSKRRLPGRGAWLHPDPDCLHRAQRRNAFGHALRIRTALDASALTDSVQSFIAEHRQRTTTRDPLASSKDRKQVDPS